MEKPEKLHAENWEDWVLWFPGQINDWSSVEKQEVADKQWRASWKRAVIHSYTSAAPPEFNPKDGIMEAGGSHVQRKSLKVVKGKLEFALATSRWPLSMSA